jgi:HD-GYP domain-containing protein (c-di-GMP phosphodiesterase class II)
LLLAVPTVAVYSALDRAQQLRAHTRAAIEALADAIDQRDKYTAEHSRRVADFADQIARALGLSLAQRDEIELAARVHDLGKISTPDAVLRAPRELTDAEWELMRQHPRVGQQILEKLPMYREGARLVGLHHERLDGRGYPLGLPAERIPLGARILTVADAFDAMTSDRPYRSAMPAAVALARLREGAGTQFAPEVVEAFARVRQGAPPAQRGALLGLAPGPPARAGAPGT